MDRLAANPVTALQAPATGCILSARHHSVASSYRNSALLVTHNLYSSAQAGNRCNRFLRTVLLIISETLFPHCVFFVMASPPSSAVSALKLLPFFISVAHTCAVQLPPCPRLQRHFFRICSRNSRLFFIQSCRRLFRGTGSSFLLAADVPSSASYRC